MSGPTSFCGRLLFLAGLAIFIACSVCEARGGRGGRSRYSGSGSGGGGTIRINDRLSIHVIGVVFCSIAAFFVLVVGCIGFYICCLASGAEASPDDNTNPNTNTNTNTNATTTGDRGNTVRYTAVPSTAPNAPNAPTAHVDIPTNNPTTFTNHRRRSYDNRSEPPSYESVVNSSKGGYHTSLAQ